jgi:hypothetical protein
MKRISKRRPVQTYPSREKKHIASYNVMVRPFLSVLWGIISSIVFALILYTLCFYPLRDICISPLDWFTLLNPLEYIILIPLSLPSMFSIFLLKTIFDVSFTTFEHWWTLFTIFSIIFAYLMITLISGIIMFLRKNRE